MYEQSARWNEFYRELDTGRRIRMLEELTMSEPDDGANRYRQLLIEARHGNGKRIGEMDRYLFQFVNLIQLYRSAHWFPGSAKREIRKLVKELLWAEAAQYGEAGERALYWELRNAAMRYFKTCEGSHYNRGLFGMKASGNLSREERICRDVWQITVGLMDRTGLKDELRVWCHAVTDAYCMYDGGGAERLMKFRK